MNNHDQPRMVSRFGNDTTYRVESAKMVATFLHMLQGTPYIYQGEEIGMTNTRLASIVDYKDVEDVMQSIYKKAEITRERLFSGTTVSTLDLALALLGLPSMLIIEKLMPRER